MACVPRCILAFGCLLATLGTTLLAIVLTEALPRFLYSKYLTRSDCLVNSQVFYGNVCCSRTSDVDIWETVTCLGIVYPCYAAKVSYSRTDGAEEQATLFNGYSEVKFQGDNISCSLYACPPGVTYTSAMSTIDTWMDTHSVGSTSACWYDPDDSTHAFANIAITASMFTQFFLWSALLCIAGVVIIVVSFILEKREDEAAADGEILVKGGDNNPEVRTEEVYGCENNGAAAAAEVGSQGNRPTTASAKGLMVKSQDSDNTSLYLPDSTPC